MSRCSPLEPIPDFKHQRQAFLTSQYSNLSISVCLRQESREDCDRYTNADGLQHIHPVCPVLKKIGDGTIPGRFPRISFHEIPSFSFRTRHRPSKSRPIVSNLLGQLGVTEVFCLPKVAFESSQNEKSIHRTLSLVAIDTYNNGKTGHSTIQK